MYLVFTVIVSTIYYYIRYVNNSLVVIISEQ